LIEITRTAIKGNEQCDAVTRDDQPPDKPIECYENKLHPQKEQHQNQRYYSSQVSPVQKPFTKTIILEEIIIVYRVEENQKGKSSE